jgi:hypothetical protein
MAWPGTTGLPKNANQNGAPIVSETQHIIISRLPLWPLAETRVAPLIAFPDRRKHVQALLEHLSPVMELKRPD